MWKVSNNEVKLDCVQIQSMPDLGAVTRAAVWGIVVVLTVAS